MNTAKLIHLFWIVYCIGGIVWALLTPGTTASVAMAASCGTCLGTEVMRLIDECRK